MRRLLDSMGDSEERQNEILASLRDSAADDDEFFTKMLQLYDTMLNLPDVKIPKRATGVNVACETEMKEQVSVSVTADEEAHKRQEWVCLLCVVCLDPSFMCFYV